MNRGNNPLKTLKTERKIGKCAKEVVSPLAKYDSNGNLFCIICKNLIKSSAIWKVHINSKLHKLNVEEAKKIDKTNFQKSLLNNGTTTRLEETKTISKLEKPVKKSKDASGINKEVAINIKNTNSALPESTDCLPEMFFDDPVVDAKIRQVEYKNTLDDEWEKFQREIKEESTSSNRLIIGEQTTSAVNREITEISEQMYQWSKVIYLENKLKNIVKKEKIYNELEDSDESVSDDEVNDFLDWRSKKFN